MAKQQGPTCCRPTMMNRRPYNLHLPIFPAAMPPLSYVPHLSYPVIGSPVDNRDINENLYLTTQLDNPYGRYGDNTPTYRPYHPFESHGYRWDTTNDPAGHGVVVFPV